jgi:hypothetical protein
MALVVKLALALALVVGSVSRELRPRVRTPARRARRNAGGLAHHARAVTHVDG